jgi:hypothetical protein
MKSYGFTAVLKKVDESLVKVSFPELNNFSFIVSNSNIDELDKQIKLQLSRHLFDMEQNGEPIPSGGDAMFEPDEPGTIKNIVFVSTSQFHTEKNKAVKKTLTIPSWLNDLAEEQNLNFSQILQEALMSQLRVFGPPIKQPAVTKKEAIDKLKKAGYNHEAQVLDKWKNSIGDDKGWDGFIRSYAPYTVDTIWGTN